MPSDETGGAPKRVPPDQADRTRGAPICAPPDQLEQTRAVPAVLPPGLSEHTTGIQGGAPLDARDDELVTAARTLLLRHYKPFWHMVAAAIRGRDGRIWTGIHLGATVGRMQVCAEAVALGRAIIEGDGTIECAVAVRHPKPHEDLQDLAVVPPCGACREMIVDFDAGAHIIVPVDGVLIRVPVRSLLPLPYQR